MVWSVSIDGSPLHQTRRQLLQKGKRVIFENMKDIWLQLEDGVQPVVLAPVMWDAHQFDDNELQEYPNCTSKFFLFSFFIILIIIHFYIFIYLFL